MSYPRKTEEIQQAKQLKAKYPGLPITKIAKIVGVHSSTLYTSDWYKRQSRRGRVQINIRPSLKSARPAVTGPSQEVEGTVELLRMVTEVQVKLLAKLTSLYEQS